MPEGREDRATVETHSLLLSLAGLVDDELLGWCRELVAVGEGDYAVELVTSVVQADRVRLPAGPHAALLDAATRRYLLGRPETFPPEDPQPTMRHRFTADPAAAGLPAPATSPEAALREVPARLLRDCRIWLTWRITPAGSAPGPLPHPVLLVEATEAAGADVLAYQVGEVLWRSGVFASIEVFASREELGEYHRAALAEANRVELGGSGARPFPELVGTGPNAVVANGGPSKVSGPSAHPGAAPNGTAAPGAAPNSALPNGAGPNAAGPNGAAGSAAAPNGAIPNGVAPNGAGPGGERPRPGPRPESRAGQGAGDRAEPPRPADLPRRPGPPPEGRDAGRRPPLHPVDRVIAARESNARRPRPDGADDLAPGPNLDRSGERTNPGLADAPADPADGLGPAPVGMDGGPDTGLSDVEQRLLRQLHEELAARDEQSSEDAARRPSGNGQGPRPQRPSGPPPEQAG
jgi:hypothetical protein